MQTLRVYSSQKAVWSNLHQLLSPFLYLKNKIPVFSHPALVAQFCHIKNVINNPQLLWSSVHCVMFYWKGWFNKMIFQNLWGSQVSKTSSIFSQIAFKWKITFGTCRFSAKILTSNKFLEYSLNITFSSFFQVFLTL